MERDESPREPATTTFNILFVCTGNTCRSPMAEALAREDLERRGWRHVQVGSAGISAEPGTTATPEACAAVRRRGLELDAHSARLLTPELVEWADLILAMSPSHLRAVSRAGGEHKMSLIGDFAVGSQDTGRDVPDPFGRDEAAYEATLRALERLVHDSLDRLAPIVNP